MLARKPFKVEFSGTPEAGKTTAISNVANKLRADGYKVIVLKESAEALPEEFEKGSFDANLWMHFRTQAGILKALHSDADIVLIDRGIIDSSFYGYKFLKQNMCSEEQYEDFLKTFVKRLTPDLFIALTVSPELSIRRRGGEGRLVNLPYIQKYNNLYMEFFETVKIPKELVNTDPYDVYEMNDIIYKLIISYLP